jgi:hypothetical protein
MRQRKNAQIQAERKNGLRYVQTRFGAAVETPKLVERARRARFGNQDIPFGVLQASRTR